MSEKRKSARKSPKPAQKPGAGARMTPRAALSAAKSAQKSVGERVEALAQLSIDLCRKDANLQAVLTVLRDTAEPVEVRLAALQALQAASFSVVAFEPCRNEYVAALREVAEDPDPELRQRALGILARQKDGFAQKKLLAGLEDPASALVTPEKALQLLSYDAHAEAYSAARAIVDQPPNTSAKREALRLLAADATAGPMFEKLLRDKGELPEIRQVSAAALHMIEPDRLQEHAREILLDTSEGDEIQATSLTALMQFGNQTTVAGDEALMKRVDRLSTGAAGDIKDSALRFLGKYGK